MRFMTFGLSSLGHSMTFIDHLDSCVPFAGSSSFSCTLGLRPLASCLLYTHFPGGSIYPEDFQFHLCTDNLWILFPLHISPLNARLVLLSPPGCLISIFKHKMSKTELLFFSPGPVPPLPYCSSWQVCPSSWPGQTMASSFSFPHIPQPIWQQSLCFYLWCMSRIQQRLLTSALVHTTNISHWNYCIVS